MQSRHRKNSLRNPKMEGSVPSLLELCIRTAIDNVRYLGDVGATDEDLLARILPHCNVDQLTTIENSTKGRDLSPITDKLWQGFYKKEFGSHNFDSVIENMEELRVSYTWKRLYEAKKLQDLEEAQERSFARMKEKYKEAGSRKQSRQVQPTSKIPPTSNKRTFYGGPGSLNIASTKSGIMKKAKLEFLNSNEMKNLAAVKKNTVQKRPIIPAIRKQAASSSSSSKFSASTSKFGNSMGRRY